MSVTNSHEPIYNQDDMDVVLSKLRKAEKEAEQSHQLLWAVIHEAGGEVALPHRLWIESDDEVKEIIMWDDPVEFKMHLKVKKE
jgi:hypothetical protein